MVGEIIRFRKSKPGEKYRGKTLCASGFHHWEVLADQPFAVRRGALITRYRCTRCGATRTRAE